mmetsp:Transcript_59059/g.118560  ORF Transcript_59059/g.118560 Transcript_59059/m.118560 type:complete len:200 (+) Transcript_59059:102-701(+)
MRGARLASGRARTPLHMRLNGGGFVCQLLCQGLLSYCRPLPLFGFFSRCPPHLRRRCWRGSCCCCCYPRAHPPPLLCVCVCDCRRRLLPILHLACPRLRFGACPRFALLNAPQPLRHALFIPAAVLNFLRRGPVERLWGSPRFAWLLEPVAGDGTAHGGTKHHQELELVGVGVKRMHPQRHLGGVQVVGRVVHQGNARA